ncbi:MAG: hypothetical protein ACI9R3_003095 [Verrucomicrobiales bacterium]|jgi:hypothetical protein
MTEIMKLTTAERALAIAEGLQSFPHAMGAAIDADDLLEWVRLELGHAKALDEFCKRGTILSRAKPPKTILHVVAGNTVNAALQSLAMGLLLGSKNRLKLPTGGAEVAAAVAKFVMALPSELSAMVDASEEFSDDWLREANAVIVYGSDETVAHFREMVRPRQKFVAHGHRLSFAIVFDPSAPEAAYQAATDISLFDQQGCLSPHTLYVRENSAGEARHFAEDLSKAMETFNVHTPRQTLTAGEAQEIQHLRSSYAFRAANDQRVSVWQSKDSTDWTVIFEEDPQFAVSCLNRLVFVKPLPPMESMPEHLRLVRAHLSSVAISPCSMENVRAVMELGISRICALGQSQLPTPFWHQEGQASLPYLVDWIDVEGEGKGKELANEKT